MRSSHVMLLAASLLWPAVAIGKEAVAKPARTPMATINAMIDASEWDPPVYLSLDTMTGAFSVTQLKPPSGRLGRRFVPLRIGTLSPDQRHEADAAFRAALAAGLSAKPCDEIIISNAGPVSLTLIGDDQTISSTPVEKGCWSSEARHLHKLVTRLFW